MSGINLQEFLFDNHVYTAWQFVLNTQKTLHTAEYCRKTIAILIEQMKEEHSVWVESLSKKLADQATNAGKVHALSIRSDDLPRSTVSVAGEKISSSFLMDKLAKDFFQYSRNAFDCMSQIVNAACLGTKAKKLELVDFGTMYKILSQASYSTAFPDMKAWYDIIAASPEFIYIDSFCNRTKHTCDVYLKVSMEIFGGKSETSLNPFYQKSQQYDRHDIGAYLFSISCFVETAFQQFIDVLQTEVNKKAFIENRYHELKVYQQKLKSDPENSFSLVYIDHAAPISSAPETIQVLLLKKDADGEIHGKNCPVDTIYISDPAAKNTFLGKYIALNTWGDDTLLCYRTYKKEEPAANSFPVFMQAMLDPENKKVFYHSNPFMEITTTSDDDEFLARVQLPF